MPATSPKKTPPIYEIQVSSRIDPERAIWLGNLSVSVNVIQSGSVVTTLSGPVTDQAALFGILNRIRDLGLRLISVNQVPAEKGSDIDGDLDQEEAR
jgi:hypothetical protein